MQQLIDNTKKMQRWKDGMQRQINPTKRQSVSAETRRPMATRIQPGTVRIAPVQRLTLRQAAAKALLRLLFGPTPSCTHSRVIAGSGSPTPKS